MTQSAALFAPWIAATMLTSWAWFLAQASAVDTVERFVGGSLVSAAAVAVVYFTLRFSANQRDSWSRLIADERSATASARVERDDALRRMNECQLKFDEERKLRMSLEEMGLANRRQSTEDKEN